LDRCLFPKFSIKGVEIPRVILGNMPFVGESYQGPNKNAEYVERFSKVENTIEILCKVVEFGVTVTSIMPSKDKLSQLFWRALNKTINETGVEFALTPCIKIPLKIFNEPINDYRRWLTYYEKEKHIGESMLKKYLEDPILLCREEWRKNFLQSLKHSKSYDRYEINELEIDFNKVERNIEFLCSKGFDILFVEPGSEIDFLALIDRIDLIEKLIKLLNQRFNSPVFLGCHHAGSTIPILESTELKFEGYVTPVNTLGALMLPSHEHALKEIKRSEKRIVAIKTMAGGRIEPQEAYRYAFKTVGVDACMIGVASLNEVQEDLNCLQTILSNKL
jgi:hypothetical protein